MPPPHFSRPATLWYVSDGLLWDNLTLPLGLPAGRVEGRLPCSSKLLVINPNSRSARVTARFYHTGQPPTSAPFRVPAGRIHELDLTHLNQIPRNQSFWIVVESDLPVLPQARHEDYTFWEATPDSLIAVSPHPGPLEDELSWVFPDCYESDPVGPWYELETLTILNPGPRPVSVRLRYLLRNSEPGGEETIDLPAERVAQLNVWERSPRPIGNPHGPPLHILGDYAVRVDASAPVVTQTTRRARWSGYPSIIGARSTMGFPLRGRGHTTWHYPGGAVIDRGILPRAKPTIHPLSQCDNTWNLLFINNLHAGRPARATITFHRPDGARVNSAPIDIPPLRSTLHCLHGDPWLGPFTRVNEPFALTIKADHPVVPEVTCAEFEMWSQVMPGAMSAVNLYPGPLRTERTWWLGLAPAGGSNQHPAQWEQTYHLLNPSAKSLDVTLSFLGLAGRRPASRQVSIPPHAVAVVCSSDIDSLPLHQPFAVRADADRPFCAQVFVRAFTRGLPHVRAMYSNMGTPMTLEP